MNIFIPPKGINYHLDEHNIDADQLSAVLCKTADFLKNKMDDTDLIKYIDWWEHNGLHFLKDKINFSIFYSIIEPPRRLFENMPGVERVFIGISPLNEKLWYLRFYLDYDDNGRRLEGRFDITLPVHWCSEFEDEVVSKTKFKMLKSESDTYYKSIMS